MTIAYLEERGIFKCCIKIEGIYEPGSWKLTNMKAGREFQSIKDIGIKKPFKSSDFLNEAFEGGSGEIVLFN